MHQFTSKIKIHGGSSIKNLLHDQATNYGKNVDKYNYFGLDINFSAYKRLIMAMESISWRILAAQIHTHPVIL